MPRNIRTSRLNFDNHHVIYYLSLYKFRSYYCIVNEGKNTKEHHSDTDMNITLC
jgi:hypothetical protein